MYKTLLNDDSYSKVLNHKLAEFISMNVCDMVNSFLEFIEEDESNLESFFSEVYWKEHSISECIRVIKSIRDRMASYVLYEEFSPLQKYVLVNIIEEQVELEKDMEISILPPIPDELKRLIEEEVQDSDDLLYMLECIDEYEYILFDEFYTDLFLLRNDVQRAIHDTDLFLEDMSFEELNKYIDVMPVDVAEEYREFMEKRQEMNKQKEIINVENNVFTTINMYGDITNSQVQIGTAYSSQTMSNDEMFPYETILNIITEIEKNIKTLFNDLGEKAESFAQNFDELVKEVQKRDNPDKIKRTLGVLKEIVTGATGSLVASGALSLLQSVGV